MAKKLDLGKMVELVFVPGNRTFHISASLSFSNGEKKPFYAQLEAPEDLPSLGIVDYEREFEITIPKSSIVVKKEELSGIVGNIKGHKDSFEYRQHIHDKPLLENIAYALSLCRQNINSKWSPEVDDKLYDKIKNADHGDNIIGFHSMIDDYGDVSILLPTIFTKVGNEVTAKSVITVPVEFYLIKLETPN